MWAEFDRRMRRAMGSIRQAFRVKLTRVNSELPVQQFQAKGLNGEMLQDAELFQQFGFTSVPPAGAMAVAIPLGGQTSHTIVVATEHAAYRIQTLKSGEVAIYSDEGARVVIKKGRVIEVDCEEYRVTCKNYHVEATDGATFDTPLVKGTNEIADGKSTMNEMRDIYDEHDHNHGGDAGITDTPNQTM